MNPEIEKALREQAAEYAYRKMVNAAFKQKMAESHAAEEELELELELERRAAAAIMDEIAKKRAQTPERPESFGMWG